MLRIGYGYDIHRVASGRALVLGGVTIPWDRGLDGHSDADALLHAITDAVLGALALGDIGQWFPNTDPRYRGISSLVLLRAVMADPRLLAWRPLNVDATVLAERPRLAPHIPAMRQAIAGALGTEAAAVSVKATTCEGNDAIGRGEAIAAHAVLLMERTA
jgi:2-C-methyl-D-erythritol 2,4-cyclodiphosphate synthase